MPKKARITITFKNEEGEVVGLASGPARELAKVEAEAHRQLYVWRYNRGEDLVIPKGYTREQSVTYTDKIEITDLPLTHSREEYDESLGGTKE